MTYLKKTSWVSSLSSTPTEQESGDPQGSLEGAFLGDLENGHTFPLASLYIMTSLKSSPTFSMAGIHPQRPALCRGVLISLQFLKYYWLRSILLYSFIKQSCQYGVITKDWSSPLSVKAQYITEDTSSSDTYKLPFSRLIEVYLPHRLDKSFSYQFISNVSLSLTLVTLPTHGLFLFMTVYTHISIPI